ncbi:hypothetical protein, partial [Porphyromonas endodontalis]|uniref:hypothetical protein n=1 Tax=Porphyromonas endodontalis TaxID=28124 RepID=UPI00360D9042
SSQKHSSEGKTKTNATLGSISATLHEIYQLLSIDDTYRWIRLKFFTMEESNRYLLFIAPS